MGKEWDDADAGLGEAVFHHADARVEEGKVTAKFINEEATDEVLFGGVEESDGAEEGGEDAAAVDVADEDAGCVGELGHAHVDDVMLLEIDFGG